MAFIDQSVMHGLLVFDIHVHGEATDFCTNMGYVGLQCLL